MSTNIKTLVVYLDAYVTLAFNCQRTSETFRSPRAQAALPSGRKNSCVCGGLGVGGDERDRTVDLRLAKPALSQLSYIPSGAATRAHPMFGKLLMVGPSRIELPTSRLSGVRSNQLSYGPTPCGLVDQTPFER